MALGVWNFVIGHWDSIDRKMAVSQSLTIPGGIRLILRILLAVELKVSRQVAGRKR